MAYPAAGVGGAVKNGANSILNLQKWTLTPKGGVVKTTPFGAAGSWEINTATIRSWDATADGFTDPSDATGQALFLNGINSTFTVEFDIDGTHHWAGTAILTQVGAASDAQAMNTVKYGFTGTGALTYT